jgi:hypothetical protein
MDILDKINEQILEGEVLFNDAQKAKMQQGLQVIKTSIPTLEKAMMAGDGGNIKTLTQAIIDSANDIKVFYTGRG